MNVKVVIDTDSGDAEEHRQSLCRPEWAPALDNRGRQP